MKRQNGHKTFNQRLADKWGLDEYDIPLVFFGLTLITFSFGWLVFVLFFYYVR